MPATNRVKGSGLRLIEGGRDQPPQLKHVVSLTVRVPWDYRHALRVWAVEESITMSELVQRELQPPQRPRG